MKKTSLSPVLSLVALLLLSWSSFAVNTTDTRLMQQPAISSTQIAFIYANDLWVANADGTNSRRLTSDAGIESNPCFSPDGKLIAFSAEYDGNTDVYTIPVRRWHATAVDLASIGQIMCGVLLPMVKPFCLPLRAKTFQTVTLQLFTVPLSGGFPTRLVIPNAYQAAYSPDGKQMAYTPISPRFQQWKNYRGGTVSNIWVFSFDGYETVKIPMAENRSNDWNPIWRDSTVYFLSDRNGEFNLFSYNVATKAVTQLTQYTDFPINSANAFGNNIIFEQAGKLHIFDTGNGTTKTLQIGIAAELTELRPRYVKGAQNIRSAHISPSGSRAVFDFRGEIVSVPAEKGDPRNITETSRGARNISGMVARW